MCCLGRQNNNTSRPLHTSPFTPRPLDGGYTSKNKQQHSNRWPMLRGNKHRSSTKHASIAAWRAATRDELTNAVPTPPC
jgi:hypothetical protein